MVSSGTANGVRDPSKNKSLGLIANAVKRKQSFVQFFAMTAILLLSTRSLGQKYRLHDLREDTYALKQEQEGLVQRINSIKSALLHEASLDSTGVFASRLRSIFGDGE